VLIITKKETMLINNKVVMMNILIITIDHVIPIVVNVIDGPMRKVLALNNTMMGKRFENNSIVSLLILNFKRCY
jgi:hypothetical protein